LDVKDIETVINFTMPGQIESYIHRIGRTARAGKKGLSITYITPDVNSYVIKELKEVLTKANQPVPPEISQSYPTVGRSGSGSRFPSQGSRYGNFTSPNTSRFPSSNYTSPSTITSPSTPKSYPSNTFTPRMPNSKPTENQQLDMENEDNTDDDFPIPFRSKSSFQNKPKQFSNRRRTPPMNSDNQKVYKDPTEMTLGSMASKLPPNLQRSNNNSVPESFLKAKQYLEELKNKENNGN
jgi:superfamily II DNA/RNA helicase